MSNLLRTVVPPALRPVLYRHRELVKFAIVGGTTFVIDTGVWYVLKLSVLAAKPVTAGVLSSVLATLVSYVLNREWSFRTRGGRQRHHEATLFFVISGVAVAINQAPLWFSRYVLMLQTPGVDRVVQEVADFTSKSIIGVLLAMVFRYWALRKWAFPEENGRTLRGDVIPADTALDTAGLGAPTVAALDDPTAEAKSETALLGTELDKQLDAELGAELLDAELDEAASQESAGTGA